MLNVEQRVEVLPMSVLATLAIAHVRSRIGASAMPANDPGDAAAVERVAPDAMYAKPPRTTKAAARRRGS